MAILSSLEYASFSVEEQDWVSCDDDVISLFRVDSL